MGRLLERRTITSEQAAAALSASEERRARESAEEGLSNIVGYSAVFGVDTQIDTWFGSFRERIQKGAFRRAIREGHDVRALRNHDPDNLLGRTISKTLRLKEDDTGLWIDVEPPNTTVGRDTVESIRRGDLSGMSFAFIVRKEKWINGEDGSPDVRIIQDVDLFDVGPVTYPQYTQTTADLRQLSEVHKAGLLELGKEVPAVRGVDTDLSIELTQDVEPQPKEEAKVEEVLSVPTPEEEGIAVEEILGENAESPQADPTAATRAQLRLLRLKREVTEFELSRLTK